MARIHDDVFDDGLQVLTDDVDNLFICTQEPATRAEAASTYALGVKSNPTVSSPTDGVMTGRRVVVSAITDGSVSATGDATHWALVDSDRLLAAGPLSSPITVTQGNQFTLAAFSIGVTDPVDPE